MIVARAFFAFFLTVLVIFTMPLFYSMADADISYTPRTHVLKKADDALQPLQYKALADYIKNSPLSDKQRFSLHFHGIKIEFVNHNFSATPAIWMKIKKNTKETSSFFESFIAASQSREQKQQEEHINQFFRTLFIEPITRTCFFNCRSFHIEISYNQPLASRAVLPETPPPNIFFINI